MGLGGRVRCHVWNGHDEINPISDSCTQSLTANGAHPMLAGSARIDAGAWGHRACRLNKHEAALLIRERTSHGKTVRDPRLPIVDNSRGFRLSDSKRDATLLSSKSSFKSDSADG